MGTALWRRNPVPCSITTPRASTRACQRTVTYRSVCHCVLEDTAGAESLTTPLHVQDTGAPRSRPDLTSMDLTRSQVLYSSKSSHSIQGRAAACTLSLAQSLARAQIANRPDRSRSRHHHLAGPRYLTRAPRPVVPECPCLPGVVVANITFKLANLRRPTGLSIGPALATPGNYKWNGGI